MRFNNPWDTGPEFSMATVPVVNTGTIRLEKVSDDACLDRISSPHHIKSLGLHSDKQKTILLVQYRRQVILLLELFGSLM